MCSEREVVSARGTERHGDGDRLGERGTGGGGEGERRERGRYIWRDEGEQREWGGGRGKGGEREILGQG